MKEKKGSFINRRLVVLIFFAIYVIVSLILTRGEYLEMQEIGEEYTSIFYTNLKAKYLVILVSFIISYVVIYLSNVYMRKGLRVFFEQENKQMPKLPNKSISFIVSIIISFISQIVLTKNFLIFTNAAKFGITDPVFGLDISFYMFQAPFIKTLLIFTIVFLILLTAYIIIYYIATLNLYFDGIDSDTLKKNRVVKQVFLNVFLIAFMIAGLMVLNSQEIVTQSMINLNDESHTELVGAGITEVKIKLWGYRILGIVIILSAFRVVKYIKKFKVKQIIYSLMIVPAYLVVLFIAMVGFQYFYADKNELDKQKEYIGYNIKYTRDAYNINVSEIPIEKSTTMTLSEAENNRDLLNQIPVINENATLANLTEYKDNSGYYNYQTTKLGIYDINGKDSLVYVSPREIVSGANRTYSNKTYQYTHGYGAVISETNAVDEDGNIKYIQSKYDLSDSKIEIKEPRIYFGLTTNDTVVVNTKDNGEFDYPISSNDYEKNTYKGKAGISCNLLDRLIIALNEGDVKLAFSSNVTKDSKILTNRNIIDRTKKIMPYLTYDENPYMVITSEGKLVWVLDAYTTSNKYPYSQKSNLTINGEVKEINYIRNSVKVLIDAYDGTIKFYITDRTDPIAMTYRNIYPNLFQDLDSQIAEDIQKNIVYPELLYEIQSNVLQMYHNVNTEMLYRSDDVWSISTDNKDENKETVPYYTLLKTVDSGKNSIGLVVPYTVKNKQSLTSYLVGTYDNGNKLTIYKFSEDTNLPGISQLNAQIEQDPQIAEELKNLSVSGMSIIRKTFIVPINNTILYVEPVYQVRLNESNVPELKKVIIASGNKVAIGDDFSDALIKLLSESAMSFEFVDQEDMDQVVDALIKANHNLEESVEASDWELIGSDLDKVQSLIKQLEKLRTEQVKDGKK